MTFSWGALVLTLLQVANKIFAYLQQDKLIDAGYDKAIAENAAQILKNSAYAKQVMSNINALSDDDTDKLLRDLEPKR